MLTAPKSGAIFLQADSEKCKSSMTLPELLDAYIAGRETSPRYRESLRRSTKKATAYGLQNVCQLGPEPVNRLLASLPLAATTRHNIRRELLTLWKFAYEEGWASEPPLRVRRIKASHAAPEAWAPADLERMLKLAERDETVVNRRTGIRVSDVLPAWITLGFGSGLRLHDMIELRAENYRNGCVAVAAHKTGKVAVRRLSIECRKRIDGLLSRSPDKTVFRWTMPRRRAIKTWREFLDRYQIPGSSKWLRRSAATQMEHDEPGSAAKWLDHSNPQVARKHYIDQTLLGAAPTPRTPW